MRLRYGSYWFDNDSVFVATAKRTNFDTRGLPASETHTFRMRGWLYPAVSGTAAQQQVSLTARRVALERALRLQRQDLVFYGDDGHVVFALTNARALGGVRITEGPDYPGELGFEHGGQTTFTFTAEAEYPVLVSGQGGTILVAFDETLSFSGGGPARDFIEPVNAPPIRTTLKQYTVFRARQQGTAVALGSWPVAPPPLWPAHLLRNGEPTIRSPQLGARGLEFAITWAYEFGSSTPLIGRPNLWIGSG